MTKQLLYTYLGNNGTITTPVRLDGVYNVTKYRLIADNKKVLTKDNINFSSVVITTEDDVENWKEVDEQ